MIEALNQTAESGEASRQGTFRFGHAVCAPEGPCTGRWEAGVDVARDSPTVLADFPGQGRTVMQLSFRHEAFALCRHPCEPRRLRPSDHEARAAITARWNKTAHMMHLDDLVSFTYALAVPQDEASGGVCAR